MDDRRLRTERLKRRDRLEVPRGIPTRQEANRRSISRSSSRFFYGDLSRRFLAGELRVPPTEGGMLKMTEKLVCTNFCHFGIRGSSLYPDSCIGVYPDSLIGTSRRTKNQLTIDNERPTIDRMFPKETPSHCEGRRPEAISQSSASSWQIASSRSSPRSTRLLATTLETFLDSPR
jgi:hypothetical protein